MNGKEAMRKEFKQVSDLKNFEKCIKDGKVCYIKKKNALTIEKVQRVEEQKKISKKKIYNGIRASLIKCPEKLNLLSLGKVGQSPFVKKITKKIAKQIAKQGMIGFKRIESNDNKLGT